MKMHYWNGESPNLNHVSIALNPDEKRLSPLETGILYRLAFFIGSRSVKSFYSDPLDAVAPTDIDQICRVAGCTSQEWEAAKENVLSFFNVEQEFMVLKDMDQIRISSGSVSRPALPLQSKTDSVQRDGQRCVYCGDTDGPFHFDHLYPFSKGGSHRSDNIVIACAPCNLSKGDKALLEWMASK